MNKIQKKRAEKLVKFLRKIPEKHFDFDYIIVAPVDKKNPTELIPRLTEIGKTLKSFDCGAAGCAVGWFPAVFPRSFKWYSNYYSVDVKLIKNADEFSSFKDAANFFGISLKETNYFFEPRCYYDDVYEKIPPTHVADRIEKYVNTNGKSYKNWKPTKYFNKEC